MDFYQQQQKSPPKEFALIVYTMVVCADGPPRHPAGCGAHKTGRGMSHIFMALSLLLASWQFFLYLVFYLSAAICLLALVRNPDASLSIAHERVMRPRESLQEETEQGDSWSPMGALLPHEKINRPILEMGAPEEGLRSPWVRRNYSGFYFTCLHLDFPWRGYIDPIRTVCCYSQKKSLTQIALRFFNRSFQFCFTILSWLNSIPIKILKREREHWALLSTFLPFHITSPLIQSQSPEMDTDLSFLGGGGGGETLRLEKLVCQNYSL